MKNIITISLIALFFSSAFNAHSQIQVLTGTEYGTYYKQALDMNKLLPKQIKVAGNDSSDVAFLDVRKTAGSSFNFDILSDDKHPAKAAFMQMDVLYLKKMEDLMNETNFTGNLVVLMAINVEEIQLISKEGNNINSLADLNGRTVGVGVKNEGTYTTALFIQNKSKLSWNNRILSTMDATKALLLDKIDAFFVVASPPLEMLNVLASAAPVRYTMANLENHNGWADSHMPTTIAAETYPWLKTDISTFGVSSVIVVNTNKLTEEEKAQLLEWKANTIENLETLKAEGHPSWKTSITGTWDEAKWPILK